jgi:Arm DNA-binding domain
MSQHLTDAIVKKLQPPAKGNRIYYDSDVAGFGIRVTAAEARAFVLNYRTRGTGRERRITIGGFPNWAVGRHGLRHGACAVSSTRAATP